jgi:hypothetical protein
MTQFYKGLFVPNEEPFIISSMKEENVLHAILLGKKVVKQNKIDVIDEVIVCAVSFVIFGDCSVTKWLGVSNEVYNKKNWNNPDKIDPKQEPTFRHEFNIGNLLVAVVQQFTFLCTGKYKNYCQANDSYKDGPLPFYHKIFYDYVTDMVPIEIIKFQQSIYGNVFLDDSANEMCYLENFQPLRLYCPMICYEGNRSIDLPAILTRAKTIFFDRSEKLYFNSEHATVLEKAIRAVLNGWVFTTEKNVVIEIEDDMVIPSHVSSALANDDTLLRLLHEKNPSLC